MPTPNPDNYYEMWDTTPLKTSASQGVENDPSIPDGQHRAVISGFECFESKAGDIWMKWSFAVYGGMYDGRNLVRLVAPLGKRTDDDEYRAKQIGWAKKDLHALLGEIPPVMGGLLDPETRTTGPVITKMLGAIVSVSKKTTKGRDGDDRIRVYINELIAPAQAQGYESADPAVDSFKLPELGEDCPDEIPF